MLYSLATPPVVETENDTVLFGLPTRFFTSNQPVNSSLISTRYVTLPGVRPLEALIFLAAYCFSFVVASMMSAEIATSLTMCGE